MVRLSFLLSAAILLAPAPAWAHASLVRASPAVGRVVAAPHELRLKFNEPVEAALSTITLVDAGGAAMALGPAATDPKDASVLVAAVKAPLAPGGYRVRWKAVSADTHKTGGDFTFQVK